MSSPIIAWFRNDLRIDDHPALLSAAETGRPVIPLFVFDEETPGQWLPGGASRWWLHFSLQALSSDLASLGSPLVLRRGQAHVEIARLAAETNAHAVYCSRAFEPWAANQEKQLNDALEQHGIAFKRFSGCLLHDPDTLTTKAGGPFKVYSPFWRALEATAIRECRPRPSKLRQASATPESDNLNDWNLRPRTPDWAGGLRENWQPGASQARQRLDDFITNHITTYKELRDRPDLPATSRLSVHLHFGEISPAQCWHAALAAGMAVGKNAPSANLGIETFCKELAWREFSYHLLHHFPELPAAPFRDQFKSFPWTQDHELYQRRLGAWQKGATGYPIVDAGMRELWTTGWMHNRVRMIVASFLTKHLLIPWQDGEQWFWDCLVDADLASNAASWQWVAGSGADAAPYFRIFNPITQGQKFDPEGDYVRQWVPELAKLPTKFLHAPWLCSDIERIAWGVDLGRNYPEPIVDHAEARARALAAYAHIKVG